MSEAIYIKETKEFLMENGYVVKESDLTKEEVKELHKNCSVISKLFGVVETTETLVKG